MTHDIQLNFEPNNLITGLHSLNPNTHTWALSIDSLDLHGPKVYELYTWALFIDSLDLKSKSYNLIII